MYKIVQHNSMYLARMCLVICNAKDSHILSTGNNSVFVILPFEIFHESLTNEVVNFEQLGPGHLPT